MKFFRSRKSSTSELVVFYSINAQSDNLGDIEIRKRVAEWIGTDRKVYVYVGMTPNDFINAFEFESNFKLIRSPREFLKILVKSLIKKRILLILPAGPRGFGGLKTNLRDLALYFLLGAIRIRGGKAALIGGAFRVRGWGGLTSIKVLSRILNLGVVRDNASIMAERGIIQRFPDVAFDIHDIHPDENRKYISIVLRGDRPASDEFIEVLKGLTERVGLPLKFVTQVERDNEQHERLARVVGAEHVAWTGNRSEQISLVQSAYSSSLLVISDRLHGLILGVNNGAIPIGVLHDGVDKLPATFEGILNLPTISASGLEFQVVEQIVSNAEKIQTEILASKDRVNSDLESVQVQLQKLLR